MPNKISIEDAKLLALKFKGKFIDDSILNRKTLVKWECKNGHVFFKSYYSVEKLNAWCNTCSIRWKSEEICRIIFETIFRKKFPKYRADWLRNRCGYKLELDGYCEELGLAFEHNGDQHYKDIYGIKSKLENVINNDSDKLEICKDKNIKLINIPQLYQKISIKKLENIIYNFAIENKIFFTTKNIYDFSNLTKTDYSKNKLKIAKNVAKSKGGKCLSSNYLFAKDLLKFKCKNNHIWKTSYDKIVNEGTWCKTCYHNSKIKILNITKEELTELYVIQKISIKNIAKKYHTVPGKITNLLIKYNIPRIYPQTIIITKNELYELWIVKNLSFRKIAQIYKTDHKTISRRIKDLNIIREQ